MIHGGLVLNFRSQQTTAQHCCLRKTRFVVDTANDIWQDPRFIELREKNKLGQLDHDCAGCENLEKSNLISLRQGMNQGLGMSSQTDLTGPARIDLQFDISCNLACRTCGVQSSTFWQRHLKDHGLWPKPITVQRTKEDVIDALKKLDLSNLRQLVFCGGETLLGQEYWAVANWLADHVPDAKQNLTLCFQTNGTQDIAQKNYEIIEKFHLVKLHISLDGVEQQFDYLRWPAQWTQVTSNIMSLRQNLPSNVMFLIEETVSIFNLNYLGRLEKWVADNFSTNREGDIVNHTKHTAEGIYSLNNCSQEYVDQIKKTNYASLIPLDWKEQTQQIKSMLQEIKQFDQFRNQSFSEIFPEVAEFYARFW
jgi:hypothetical protein